MDKAGDGIACLFQNLHEFPSAVLFELEQSGLFGQTLGDGGFGVGRLAQIGVAIRSAHAVAGKCDARGATVGINRCNRAAWLRLDAEQVGAKRILVAIGIGKLKVLYVHAGGQIRNAVAVLPKRGGQVFAKCLVEGLL